MSGMPVVTTQNVSRHCQIPPEMYIAVHAWDLLVWMSEYLHRVSTHKHHLVDCRRGRSLRLTLRIFGSGGMGGTQVAMPVANSLRGFRCGWSGVHIIKSRDLVVCMHTQVKNQGCKKQKLEIKAEPVNKWGTLCIRCLSVQNCTWEKAGTKTKEAVEQERTHLQSTMGN